MISVQALRTAPRRWRGWLWVLTSLALGILPVKASPFSASSTGRISGRVTDLNTAAPIASATVLVDSTALSAQTDANGYFAIPNVPAGRYSLTFKCRGYDTQVRPGVCVMADSTVTLNFGLLRSKVEGDAIARREAVSMPALQGSAPSADEAKMDMSPRTVLNFKAPGIGCVLPDDNLAGLRYGDNFNTEEYTPLGENRFHDVVGTPLSTFSIDVDAASYGNARRYIRQETLPPKDAVRIEELVNYFDYDYPQPEGEDPFSVTVEQSDCPWQPEHRLIHIGLQGRKYTGSELPSSNLVFLIDVSGSMQPENKLPLVQKAFRLLVDQLRANDRVAIVVYAGAAGLVLPSTRGSEKAAIYSAIDRLSAGGSTAGAAGIQLAYQIAQENFIRGGNNRIILATDGDFNVGVSSTGDLVSLVEEKRKAGVFLTVLGFGMGNLKDSRLEQLADKGNGNYAYIDNMREAGKVFVTELPGTLFTIAKDVKLQIEFNPARIASYRLIGYENRMLNKEDFADDHVDSGELGAGHTVTALYEVVPANSSLGVKGDELRYQNQGITPGAVASDEVLTVKLRYKQPTGETSREIVVPVKDRSAELAKSSDNFRFSAAVAEFGLLLRGSEFKGHANWSQVLDLAKGSLGTDREGFRAEFVDLVHNASRLSSPQASR